MNQNEGTEKNMIKFSSITFVGLMVLLFILAFSTLYFPSSTFLNSTIHLFAVLLLIVGIVLIGALIYDRYRDYKTEGEDHKKY